MDIKRILKYQEHGDDGLFIEGMHQQEIKKSIKTSKISQSSVIAESMVSRLSSGQDEHAPETANQSGRRHEITVFKNDCISHST